MDNHKDILAKGKPEWTSLYDHLCHTGKVARKIAAHAGMNEDIAFTGAVLHDIGKAHPVFQEQIKGNKPRKPFRHEIASLFFLPLLQEEWQETVTDMIIAHHKSIINDPSERGILDLLENEPGVCDYHLGDWENWMPIALDILESTGISIRTISREEAIASFESLYEYCENTFRRKRGPSKWRGLMMAADYFASAMIEKTEATVHNLFKTPELKFYNRQHHLYPLSFYPDDKQKAHTIVVAPTGAGKTDFLLRRCRGRIFYTLPFQASINAMYKRLKNDLKNDNPDLDIRILHAASSLIGKEDPDVDPSLQEMVGSSVKVLTPYQLAGIVVGSKGYESITLDLMGCDVILDEVHTYSGISQAIVLKVVSVLKHLGCRIHIGTATMPSILYNKLLQITDGSNTYEVHLTTDEKKSFNRHKIYKIDNWVTAKEIIRKAVSDDQKILIVINRVDRAQQIFEKIAADFPCIDNLLIHSRFKRKDRNHKEKLLSGLDENGYPTGRFNTSEKACIVISTQVVEVSLDISFDIMITDTAPLDAMIQRFGRVNRKRDKLGIGVLKPVYIIRPPDDKKDALPYDPEILFKSFDVLPDGECLQETQLQDKIDKVFTKIDFIKIEQHAIFKESQEWKIPSLTHSRHSILLDMLDIDSVVCIIESDLENYQEADYDDSMDFEIPARYWSVKSFPVLDAGRRPYIVPDSVYNQEMGMVLKKLKTTDVKDQIF